MEITLATPSLLPNVGGPAYSVAAIGKNLSLVGEPPVFLTRVRDRSATSSPPAVLSRLAASDIVHNFGVWTPFNHLISVVSRRLGRPLVACPMGMLEPWCLAHKPLRKRIALTAYQRRDLDRSAVIHSTAVSESQNLRALGLQAPIVVIPHGVDLPEQVPARPQREVGSERTVLFLSRVHEKKGLLELVEAWARIRPDKWRVVIAGPDDGGHRAKVEASIRAHKLDSSFSFVGPVAGEAKRRLFSDADLFVLPTYSENFGIVVPEALAYGLPVLTTTGAPWGELLETNSGWWIEPGVQPLVTALEQALRTPSEELQQMGARGRAMVTARYSWRTIIELHLELYKWLLYGGRAPQSLHLL
jgi:glycosyltransferase involved in cell wall biosynthesis